MQNSPKMLCHQEIGQSVRDLARNPSETALRGVTQRE